MNAPNPWTSSSSGSQPRACSHLAAKELSLTTSRLATPWSSRAPSASACSNSAFELARRRKKNGGKGLVTCVDKANVFASFAFFRKIFDERAALNPDIQASHAYIDATALFMVRKPWEFDVLVTENMFGDILSDLGAGLIGGMGFVPSADIGDSHAVFQPCHGTAPDIAGQDKANPTAMVLSAAMMLEWLGAKHDRPQMVTAGRLIRTAVDSAFAAGVRPFEVGGRDGTTDIARRILDALQPTVPTAA